MKQVAWLRCCVSWFFYTSRILEKRFGAAWREHVKVTMYKTGKSNLPVKQEKILPAPDFLRKERTMSELFDVIAGIARAHASIYRSVATPMLKTEDDRLMENALEDAARQADWENKQTIENKEIPSSLAEDLELQP